MKSDSLAASIPAGQTYSLLFRDTNPAGENTGQTAVKESMNSQYVNWLTHTEISQIENNLQSFISALDNVKKESREEIFKKYDNTLKPIAYIPKEYLQYFKGTAADNRLYTGLAYFLDHAVNRHSDVQKADYNNIQDIIINPDEIIIDRRKNGATGQERDNLLFVKKYFKRIILAVSLETNNRWQILLHKTLHYNKKNTPYPDLNRVQGLSPGDGVSPISTTDKSVSAGSLSAPDDSSTIIIGNFDKSVNPDSV